MAAVEERERDWSVLLKGGAPEGDSVLSDFASQVSCFERRDGNLGAIDDAGNRAVSRDGGRTWEMLGKINLVEPSERPAAQQVYHPGGTGAYKGPAGLVKMQPGKLGLSSTQSFQIGGNQDIVDFFFQTSDDEGATWSKPVLANPGRDKGTPLFDTLRQLKSGRLIQPVRWLMWAGTKHRKLAVGHVNGKVIEWEGHGHHPEIEVAYCYFSDDEGKSWSRSEGDIIAWLDDGWNNFGTMDEPSLDQLPDGRVLMIARTLLGRLFKTISDDDGTTWSVPEPTPLCADGSPCMIRRIPSTGDLLCVWNQLSASEIRRGMRGNRLSAAVTSDGDTWKHFRALEWHGVEEAGYIEPEPKLQLVRALDDVGEIPTTAGISRYPQIAFHGDEVIISYAHMVNQITDPIGKMKHRILPVGWFYEKA